MQKLSMEKLEVNVFDLLTNTTNRTFNNDVKILNVETTVSGPLSKIINDDIYYLCTVIIKCAVYEVTSVIGIVPNILNIIIFSRLGFKDTVNVSLLGLAVADLSGLVVLMWMGICHNPLFVNSDVHFDTLSLTYLTGGWLKLYFTRVTSWITAFITLERCLCVIIPLKVKTIVTPRTSVWVILAIFLVIGSTMPPIYYTTRLDWKWYPDRNKTLLGLTFTEDRYIIYSVVLGINQLFTFGSFFCVIICTVLLVTTLKRKSKWRQSVATTSERTERMSKKEEKVTTMVLFIAVIFLVCLFPGTLLSLAMIIFPEFNKGERYHNLFTTVWAISHVLEATNSSVNIFVYIRMSSKFNQVYRQMFSCKENQDADAIKGDDD